MLACGKVYFFSTLFMESCQELEVLRGRTPSAPLLCCSILVYFFIFMAVLVIIEVKSNSQHSNAKSQFFTTYSYKLCLFKWSFPLDIELKHTGKHSQYTAERFGSRNASLGTCCTRKPGMWDFSLLPDVSSSLSFPPCSSSAPGKAALYPLLLWGCCSSPLFLSPMLMGEEST